MTRNNSENTNKVTKEYCITKYKELKKTLGHQPDSREFYEQSDISQYQIKIFFRTFAKLAQAAGDQPNLPLHKKNPKKLDDELFEKYAIWVREIKNHPTSVEWLYQRKAKPMLGLPDEHAYRRLGLWSNMPEFFRSWAVDKPQYIDVLPYLPLKKIEPNQFEIINRSISFEDFIPPIIQNIEKIKDSLEFEKKVVHCFRLLGFNVDSLGQGQGQNPDGIASCPKDGYAIIYDAKSHEDGYSISASDRRAAEQYIEDHREQLGKEGIKTLFFSFVARTFNSESKKSIQGIREKTNVTAVLLTISGLLQLTAFHIQNPYDFDYAKLKSLLSKGGQIDAQTVQIFLAEIQKQSRQ